MGEGGGGGGGGGGGNGQQGRAWRQWYGLVPCVIPSQETHLREIGISIVGDRLVFMDYLKLLKKHKRDADRSKSLWSGTTPVLSLAYHHNCGEFCFHVSCGRVWMVGV